MAEKEDLEALEDEAWSVIEPAELGDVVELARVLAAGARPDATSQDAPGETALIKAAAWGNEACLRILLEAGASVEAKTLEGLTALHVAARNGTLGCARLLIEEGVDKDARDADGRTPAMLAAIWGRVEGLAFMLEAGCDAEARDAAGLGLFEHAKYSTAAGELLAVLEARELAKTTPRGAEGEAGRAENASRARL